MRQAWPDGELWKDSPGTRRDLQYVKQQFDSCATEAPAQPWLQSLKFPAIPRAQADLRKLQEKLQDVQEENGRPRTPQIN